MRLMGSDVDQVQDTAEAVIAALQLSPQLIVGDVSVVPNKRGPGVRCYIEVVLRQIQRVRGFSQVWCGEPAAGEAFSSRGRRGFVRVLRWSRNHLVVSLIG
jgi:hypothetical protein